MTGTEECSAKMTFSHDTPFLCCHPSPLSSIPIWKHAAGRNCLNRAQRRRQSRHRRDWGFSQATDREANQSWRWAVCGCDHSPEYIYSISLFRKSQLFQARCNFLIFTHFCLAAIVMSQSRSRLSCHLQLHFHPSNGCVYVYLVN